MTGDVIKKEISVKNCVDVEDFGDDAFTPGKVIYVNSFGVRTVKIDECIGWNAEQNKFNKLNEWYCYYSNETSGEANGTAFAIKKTYDSSTIECSKGCLDRACILSSQNHSVCSNNACISISGP